MATNKQTETPEQINARVLATVTVDNAFIARFKAYTKSTAWPAKFAGPVPSDAMLMTAGAFAKSAHATSEPGFLSMLLRDQGCTDQQHNTGFNCRNAHNFVWHHATGLVSLGYFKREQLSKGCWRLFFTPKGEKFLANKLLTIANQNLVAGQTVNPVKVRAAKAKKAKAKKAAPVVSATVQPVDASVLIPAAPVAPVADTPATDNANNA